MHILFTRPFDDCHELMLRFKSLGHMVSHIPVISIQKIIYESLDFSLFKGIIFTSSNAIKFLDTQKIDKQIKCFCVGNATEKVAKTRGFQKRLHYLQSEGQSLDGDAGMYNTKTKKFLKKIGKMCITVSTVSYALWPH